MNGIWNGDEMEWLRNGNGMGMGIEWHEKGIEIETKWNGNGWKLVAFLGQVLYYTVLVLEDSMLF